MSLIISRLSSVHFNAPFGQVNFTRLFCLFVCCSRFVVWMNEEKKTSTEASSCVFVFSAGNFTGNIKQKLLFSSKHKQGILITFSFLFESKQFLCSSVTFFYSTFARFSRSFLSELFPLSHRYVYAFLLLSLPFLQLITSAPLHSHWSCHKRARPNWIRDRNDVPMYVYTIAVVANVFVCHVCVLKHTEIAVKYYWMW